MEKLVPKKEAPDKLKVRLRYAIYLLMLYEKHDIYNIHVSDLVSCAYISRTTFYNYYNDMSDFLEDIAVHFAKVMLQQEKIFLAGGRDSIKKNCKQKNLVISLEDRQFLNAFRPYITTDLIETFLPIMHKCFLDCIDDFPFSEEFIEKNKSCIGFFIFGFSKAIFNSISDDLTGKDLSKTVNYTFDLWDDLFPDNKLC